MDEELHFKTGKRGKVARFFANRRFAHDPYEETVIFPALVVTATLQAYDLGRIGDKLLITALFAIDVGAGMWLGICLGLPGTVRVVLRSISVSIIEAGLLAFLNDKVDKQQAFLLTSQLITINGLLFWVGHIYASSLREIMLVSETQWSKSAPRRRWLYSVYRISVGAEKLEGAPDDIVIAVIVARVLIPPLAIALIARLVFGVSVISYIQHLLHV